MKKLTAVILLLILVTVAATAQDKPKVKLPEFEKTIKVNLFILDVVVVDKNGNYVQGLTKDDFVVYENNKQVPISSVDEYFPQIATEGEDINPANLYESPPRNIIFVLDRYFSSSSAIKRGKEAIIKFCQEKLNPGDRVMLITYDQRFKVAQDLTTNHRALEMSAESLSSMTRSSETPEFTSDFVTRVDRLTAFSTTNPNNRQVEVQAKNVFQNIRLQHEVKAFFDDLKALSYSLKTLPGRKTVIMLSEGYDQRILDESTVGSSGRSPDARIIRSESTDAMTNENTAGRGATPVLSSRSSLLSDYNEAIESINNSSTSFYMVDISSLESHRSRSDVFQQQSLSAQNTYDTARTDSLNSLADATGGKLYSGTRNVDRVLDSINRDISNYYIIAFESPDLTREGRYRKTRVELKNKDYSIRSRKGFTEPKNFTKLDEREKYVHLMEGFFRSSPINEINAKSFMFFLPVYEDTIVGALSVKIPFNQLNGEGEKVLEVIGNINDSFNKRIDAFHKQISYGGAIDKLAEAGELSIKLPFVLKRGENRIRVIVRDNSTGKRYFMFDEYNVRGAEPDELSMSSIALVDENLSPSTMKKFKLPVKNKGTETGFQGYTVADPLRAAPGKPLLPIIDMVFSKDDKPVVFFTAGNFWQEEKTGKVDFYIDYAVINDEGEEIVIPVGKETLVPVPGTKRVNVLSQLLLNELEPGEYKLRIRFLDQQKLQGVQRFLDIRIK